jgi:hypothetical protein
MPRTRLPIQQPIQGTCNAIYALMERRLATSPSPVPTQGASTARTVTRNPSKGSTTQRDTLFASTQISPSTPFQSLSRVTTHHHHRSRNNPMERIMHLEAPRLSLRLMHELPNVARAGVSSLLPAVISVIAVILLYPVAIDSPVVQKRKSSSYGLSFVELVSTK